MNLPPEVEKLKNIIAGSALIAFGVCLCLWGYTPAHTTGVSGMTFYKAPDVSFLLMVPGIICLIVGGFVLIKGKREYLDSP